MTIETSITAQVLEAWGATAKPLPTSSKEESDWLAVLGGCHLLIEEKTKFDDPVSRKARNEALAAGQVHGATLPLTHNNKISGIVRKAASQFGRAGIAHHHYTFCCLFCLNWWAMPALPSYQVYKR